MKHIFVLDENVYIQSHTCKAIQDSQDDYDSFHLILHILEECHKIGLCPQLIGKYQEKSKILEEKRQIGSGSIRIWKHLLTRNDKQSHSTSSLNDLPSNLLHDRHIIEPTLFLSGILVTTDEKLKERLIAWAKGKKVELHVMSPKDAILHLSKSSR